MEDQKEQNMQGPPSLAPRDPKLGRTRGTSGVRSGHKAPGIFRPTQHPLGFRFLLKILRLVPLCAMTLGDEDKLSIRRGL